MKNSMINTGKVMMGLAFVLIAASLQAQPGSGYHRGAGGKGYPLHTLAIPDLTDEQEQKISALRTSHQKEVLNLRLDLDIKAATLQKIKSAENPDMSLINKTIDEMGVIHTEIQKKKTAHEFAIRKLLTEEQRVVWDSHIAHTGQGRNRMPSNGCDMRGPAGGMYRHGEGRQNL
jgi:Spy/CpxP family protein refolding chaperone